jgi:flagellar hook capping protein FlgD
MGRLRMMLVVAPLALVTLVGAAPWRSLPPCVIGRFGEITSTDPQGTVVGVTDPSDWGCLGGQAGVPAGVPPQPPTQFCFEPAYPNPSSGEVRLRFTLPRASLVTITVYGQKHGPRSAFLVSTLAEGNFAAGEFTLLWDGNDDQGARVPPGLYRAVMTVPDGTICGDIEIR